MKNVNHLNYLHDTEYDLEELKTFFMDEATMKMGEETYKVEMNDLNLEFSRKNKLIGIWAGKDVPEKLKLFKAAVSFNNEIPMQSASICFTTELVRDVYDIANIAKISPPPADAPLPGNRLFADYPFILTYHYSGLQNPEREIGIYNINFLRRNNKRNELIFMLNLLLKGGINTYELSQHFEEWVLDRDKDDQLIPRYLRPGYLVYEIQNKDDYELSNPIAHDEYYDARTFHTVSPKQETHMLFPDSLEKNIQKYYSLRTSSKEKFITACHWFYQSKKIWGSSKSAAFVFLVSAIESMIKRRKIVDCEICGGLYSKAQICQECNSQFKQCNKCNHKIFEFSTSLTHEFSQFVETYAPAENTDNKNALYKIRSDLVHGDSLFLGDLIDIGMGINPLEAQQSHALMEMSTIVRFALLNWLTTH